MFANSISSGMIQVDHFTVKSDYNRAIVNLDLSLKKTDVERGYFGPFIYSNDDHRDWCYLDKVVDVALNLFKAIERNYLLSVFRKPITFNVFKLDQILKKIKKLHENSSSDFEWTTYFSSKREEKIKQMEKIYSQLAKNNDKQTYHPHPILSAIGLVLLVLQRLVSD
ncbi:MAG: hypothetical protein JXA94_02965 [Parachlamydiales bacterium]|nr:hypothetical protein [Parachlamydiales bacterium]